MRARVLSVAVLAVLACAPAARADAPPLGSTWSQATIAEPDGTKLHADVLRPSNLPAGAKTPVIVSVGPYFNHSGQTGPLGPVEGTPYDPTAPAGVSSASIALPWRSCEGGAAIQGAPSIKLDSYKADAPFTVDAATIAAATDQGFALPGALGACS